MANRKGDFGLRANLCVFRFWFPDGQLVRPGKLTINETGIDREIAQVTT